MTSTEPLQRQRVRKSRKPAKGNPLHGPRVGRAIFIGMAIVTLGFVFASVRSVDQAGRILGAVGLGDRRDDVRYMLGAPQVAAGADAASADGWRYRLPEGGTMLAEFDPAGVVRRLSCEDPAMTPASCSAVLGVRLGDTEMAVLYRLGRPTRQSYSGEVKSLTYDDIGITFQLTRFAVQRVVLDRRASRFAFLPRTIRYMVP